MAEAVIVAQTVAVVAAIEAMTNLGQTFTIERNYADFELELTQLTALRIDVTPVRHTTSELETRGSILYETDIDICIRRKFGESDSDPDCRLSLEAVDDLVKFTEDLHARLVAETLNDENESRWQDAKLLWCPHKKHLRQRQFTGLIRVSYETTKELP